MANQAAYQPQLFGLLAHPAKHSLSPLMHNAAFQALKLPYHYHAFDIPPDQLEEALKGLKLLGIKGFNVTIPHKERIIPFLSRISEEAQAIGAVNTVVNKDGELFGYNTDGAGYVQSLIQETRLNLSEATVLLLGAGGAAKGIAINLLKSGCKRLILANRTEDRAKQLIQQLSTYAKHLEQQVELTLLPWNGKHEAIHNATVMINTTSIGLWPQIDETPIQLENLSLHHKIVSDIIYNPLETKLLKEAKELGAQIHTGLGMFVNQGALAFKLFTDIDPPVEIMQQIVLQHLLDS